MLGDWCVPQFSLCSRDLTTAIPALSEAKFRLYSALRAAGVSKIDLARRLKCSPSQVDRLLDI